MFIGDALYEIDIEGVKPPRYIATLEYPMSATAKGDNVLLSSCFTGAVQGDRSQDRRDALDVA